MPQYVPWEVIEAIERGAHRVLLFGPPGTGKTRSAYNAAKALKKSIYNITLSDETPAAELRGHFVPQGTKFVWMDGPAVRAFKEGAILLLDEIDKASQDALDFLHGLLNDRDVAQLTLPSGEQITPHEGFQVIAAMNGEIQDLAPALQDRFSIAIEVTEPHPDAVSSLPEDLQAVARNVESYEAAQRPATIRRWTAFATLREIKGVGVENAAKAVFAHRATELMDAIGFRTTVEADSAVEEHEEELSKFCSCDDCKLERARDWLESNWSQRSVDWDEEDEVYYCLNCGNEYEDEEEAVLCCYDDDEWIANL